ncbi:MAG: FG-GAP-like repeat-containing protein, partial [Anaerolineae bacterium]
MPYLKRLFLVLLILAFIGLVWLTGLGSRPQGAPVAATAITVSGTVTGPSGPVSDASIFVNSPQGGQHTTTNASGFYSVSIETEGQLWFHVRPDVSTRLTQVNRWMAGVSASFTQNFSVTHGYLLGLQLTGSDGAPITTPTGFEIQPLIQKLPANQWYGLDWDESTARYWGVLPPDAYYVTAPNPPGGYYRTSQPFDLRTADQVADLPLNTTYVHPIPYDPPDATKITFSPVDDLGQATVSGAAGAALPLAHVLLVNLNTNHQAHTTTGADGSFSARIYAPPGSAVMIKHGPPSERWHNVDQGVAEGLNPLPGTIINLPHTHSGGAGQVPFAGVGAMDILADDMGETRNYVGAAWAITGTIGPVIIEGQWTRVLSGTYDGQPAPGLYLGGLNWTHPALGDLDGDDDLELLVGERSGQLVLYRNHGNATSPDWQFETAAYAGVDTGGWTYPALADVTGDGAPDLFVGAGDGTVSIYYNDDTSFDKAHKPTQALWPAD